MTFTRDDSAFMAQALILAERGRYTTRPNPRVGCVLVKNSVQIACGWHYRAGQGHAEVQALGQLGHHLADGATAYVTLEPCAHQGRTGACALALIEAGVTRVVYGMADPNPLVESKGLAMMRDAGIQVDGPLLEAQAKQLNQGFIRRMTHQLPWVRCKVATSLDGRSAMASGESQWITAAPARKDVQKLRAQSCAIITGIGSIKQDNSRLNLRRDELGLDNVDDVLALPPLRVVLDSQLCIRADAAIFQSPGKVVVFTRESTSSAQEEALVSACANELVVERVQGSDNGLDLLQVLSCLARDYQCNEVLVEAGARLTGAFLAAKLIDELIIYQAPILMGSDARALADLPLQWMQDKVKLTIKDRRMVGDDCRISAIFD